MIKTSFAMNSPISSEPKSIPEAPESSAGDDFHILWAALKSLELLIPNGELKALGIEGPSQKDSVIIDTDGDKLLGIDLSEYYNGDNFETSSCVVFSQLKYSTRHPSESWTASRICKGKKRGAGSIVHRAS